MADQSIIIRHQSAVGTSTAVNVDFGTAIQRLYVTAKTADVLIEPNGSANTDSFRIINGTTHAAFDLRGSNVRTVGLLGAGGTSDVTLMGVVA